MTVRDVPLAWAGSQNSTTDAANVNGTLGGVPIIVPPEPEAGNSKRAGCDEHEITQHMDAAIAWSSSSDKGDLKAKAKRAARTVMRGC